MNLRPLTNRNAADESDTPFQLPADGWYQIAPTGEYPVTVEIDGKPERLVQVLDAAAFAQMVNRFETLAAADDFPGLLIDYDHFSMDLDKSTEAGGWLHELTNRDDGLWGKIRWSGKGKADVLGGNFRFLSPVFDHATAEKLPNKRVRPTQLDLAALTNDPNLRGMVPLSNRNSGDKPQNQETAMKEQLATLLGLDPADDDKAYVDKIQALKNRATQAAETEAKVAELEKAQLETQVEADLEEHKAVIANRDDMKAQLLANRAAAIAVLKSLKPFAPEKKKTIPNRRTGTPTGDAEDKENAVRNAAAIRNRAAVIQKEQGVNYRTAFRLARAEIQG